MMKIPRTYKMRNPNVAAMYFESDGGNLDEIHAWARAGGGQRHEDKILFRSGYQTTFWVAPGQWLVLASGHWFAVSGEDFFKTYEEVK